jgi:UDP-N-acetylmuramate dehydrogenase
MTESTRTSLNLRERVDLAPLTTLGIGGPARWYVAVSSRDELVDALELADREQLPLLMLGGGSNMLISDRGFDGLVIHVDLRGVTFDDRGPDTFVTAAAGEDWDGLVQETVRRNLAGFECLSGIPGRVGATPIQNVGAYGQEVAETIVELEALDRPTRQIVRIANDECGFSYRDSRFKSREPDRFVILGVTYRLQRDGEPSLRYPDLQRHLEEEGITSPTLADVREMVLQIRAGKGMVVDPDDPDSRSAGSFFTNPIIPESELETFLLRVKRADVLEEGEKVPHYGAAPGQIKLSAAWLIQHAGFYRGFDHGNVGLSYKHTLAIVNRGGGTATEVIELVEDIQRRVRRLFGIQLVPEPNFIGF